MHLDEGAVSRGVSALTRRSFARGVHRGDSRVMRYRQEISATLHLHKPELAALCVLLLRGPQTVGEIRTRTARMAEFTDLRHVEITLDSLATLPTPLVAQLPRRAGQKEVRYTHLLAGEAAADAPEPDAGGGVPRSSTTAASEGGALRATLAVDRAPSRVATDRIEALEQEVASLRAEMAELRAQLEAFRQQFE
jgi:uncharacterized protein YceH (UPF0502 family)